MYIAPTKANTATQTPMLMTTFSDWKPSAWVCLAAELEALVSLSTVGVDVGVDVGAGVGVGVGVFAVVDVPVVSTSDSQCCPV